LTVLDKNAQIMKIT